MGWLMGLPLKMYAYAGIALLVVGLGLGLKIQTSRLASAKAELVTFKAETKAAGNAAEAARQKDILDRKAISTKQETDNAKRYASLDARYRAAVARVSKPNPGSGEAQPLSAAAAVLGCPGGQPDIAGRLAELEIGVLALLERGDRAIERTITCKAWIENQVAANPAP